MKSLAGLLVVLWSAAVSSTNDEWWRTASIYQIYPRSFKDSDGDGVGDLTGIEQMANYFNELQIDAVWLSPFQTSPMKDFGYDITDFKGVDPLFGTMDDFKSLFRTLQNLGIRFLLDFVPNHTSDQHDWFKLSLNRTDPYTDFYVWSNGTLDQTTGNYTPPNNWLNVWTGSAWEWSEERQQYYFHQFIKEQPDLNFRNPKVREAILDVIEFWLDLGVDGLRVDSAKHIFEVENLTLNEPQIPGTSGKKWADFYHPYTTNLEETYDLLDQWAQLFHNYSVGPNGKPRVMLLECYDDINTTMKYYGKGNTSLMMPFNFELLGGGGSSARASTYKKMVDEWMTLMPPGNVANWVVGNHDQKRVATMCGTEMVDAINILTSLLSGVKISYQGEEIGMQNTFIRWDQTVDPSGLLLGPEHYQEMSRDPERTPMQWDDSSNAGFSTNSSTWLPVNPNYWWLNVAAQRSAQSSHLKVFQAMSQLRKDPVLQRGDLTTITPNNDTFIVLRSANQSHYVLIINMASNDSLITSQSLFSHQHLDMDMEVVVTSTNIKSHKVGDIFKSGSISISLRPKAAILLKSPPSSSSSASLNFAPLVLLLSLFVKYFR